MDLLFYIATIFTLMISGGRSVPRPYSSSSGTANSTVETDNRYSAYTRLGIGWTGTNTRNRNQTIGGSGSFVFPTDDPTEEPKLAPIKSCPEGSSFCETADDYPSSYVAGLLQNSAIEYKALFGNDVLEDTTLTQRIDQHNENPLCESTVEIVFPKKAEDKDGEWKYVVNYGAYKQGVRVEKCRNENEPCSYADAFPLGHRVYCKQKYIYRKLVGLNDQNLETMDFPLPSCCQCTVVSPLTRSGLSTRQSAGSTTKKPASSTKSPPNLHHKNTTNM